MNKILLSILILLFINNCSFNKNSNLWSSNDKDYPLENKKNIKKVFDQKKNITTELNEKLKINLKDIKFNNDIVENKNNYGSFDYQGLFLKNNKYKFSKLINTNELNFKPIFLDEGIIFFEKKGNIIKYNNNNKKHSWKKNFYSKVEKKMQPKLHFAIKNDTLLVADNIAKYYSININDGKLNWSKNNRYPFNSEIKIFKDKFFVVDYKNTLRCYNISDGLECWNLQTENSFTVSNSKHSIILVNGMVIFNNSIGDITAADIKTGSIIWQLPTQNSNVVNEAYSFKTSKLVSDGNSIFFSNNKNEFYSIDAKTGTLNWVNMINSNLTPIIINDFIFTVTNNGYLFTVQKKTGNIIRINDLYKDYKTKEKIDIKTIGFSIGLAKMYLTNNNGKLIVIDLISGNILDIKKISRKIISKPFIFNKNLYIIENGSIIQYN